MKKTLIIASFVLLSSASVLPALATQLDPVAPEDLSRFAGLSIRGFANANLGTVSQVDTNTGIIGIAGRYGEFAFVSTSMLARDGNRLHAPTMTVGDLKMASDANLSRPGATLVRPNVIINEPTLR